MGKEVDNSINNRNVTEEKLHLKPINSTHQTWLEKRAHIFLEQRQYPYFTQAVVFHQLPEAVHSKKGKLLSLRGTTGEAHQDN